MAKRAGDKVLKGLQGTAAATIIGRAVHDSYEKAKTQVAAEIILEIVLEIITQITINPQISVNKK
jgi:hypothetical protein